MPTNLTIACFLPNPDADENFRKKQQIKQGDAWIIPRDEIGEKVEYCNLRTVPGRFV